jgi:hypothetical protein
MNGVVKQDVEWKELLKRPTYGQTIGLPVLLPGKCIFSYDYRKTGIYHCLLSIYIFYNAVTC